MTSRIAILSNMQISTAFFLLLMFRYQMLYALKDNTFMLSV